MHVEAVEDVSFIREEYQKQIFSVCSPEKLLDLENSALKYHLNLSTEEFWENHCKVKFNVTVKNKRTWRETYRDHKQNSIRKMNLLKKQFFQNEKKEKEKKEQLSTSVINRAPPISNNHTRWRSSTTSHLPGIVRQAIINTQSKSCGAFPGGRRKMG